MKKRARIVSGLAALAALLLAPLAEASITRASNPPRETPELSLALVAAEPSAFSLFEGIELAAAAGESALAPSFHPLAAVSLLSKDGAERPLVSVDELIYPKTRYRVFGLLGTPILGELRGVSLELQWRSGEFRAGLASGTVGWLSQDPMGDRDSVNLYGFVGMKPHMGTDPLGLLDDYNDEFRFQKQEKERLAREAFCGANPAECRRQEIQGAGLMRVGGAALQATLAAPGCAAPEPVLTKAACVAALTLAFDNAVAGARQAWTGEEKNSVTEKVLEKGCAGVVEPQNVRPCVAVTDIALNVVATGLARPRVPQLPSAEVNVLKPGTGLSASEAELVRRIEPELASITSRAAQTVRAGQATGPAAARYAAFPTPTNLGSAVQEEAFSAIRAAQKAGQLPSGLSLNLGRQLPGGGSFSPLRPDLRLPLGGGREAVWDITNVGSAGHAAHYADASHAKYVAELLY